MGLRDHVHCAINASTRDRQAPDYRLAQDELGIHYGSKPDQRGSDARQEGTYRYWRVHHYYLLSGLVNLQADATIIRQLRMELGTTLNECKVAFLTGTR